MFPMHLGPFILQVAAFLWISTTPSTLKKTIKG